MLSNHHVDLLNTIRWGKVVRDKASNPDLEYLHSLGLITLVQSPYPSDPYAEPHLTEKGQAALDQERRTRIRHWVPVVIADLLSLAAVILSVIALSR